MTPLPLHPLAWRTRRQFLRDGVTGLGGIALAGLLADEAAAADKGEPLAPRPPHYRAKAKNIIVLHLSAAAAPRPLRLQARAGKAE